MEKDEGKAVDIFSKEYGVNLTTSKTQKAENPHLCCITAAARLLTILMNCDCGRHCVIQFPAPPSFDDAVTPDFLFPKECAEDVSYTLHALVHRDRVFFLALEKIIIRNRGKLPRPHSGPK